MSEEKITKLEKELSAQRVRINILQRQIDYLIKENRNRKESNGQN